MRKIFVTTTATNTDKRPWARSNYRRMIRAGEQYRGSDFGLTPDPEEADYILFVDSSEPYLGDVYRSPVFRKLKHRCYVHNANDHAMPVLPGMYPDVPGPVRLPDLQLGAFYLRCFENQLLLERKEDNPTKWLFSFVGDVNTAPLVRSRVLGLRHPDALLLNRSSGLKDDDLDYVDTLRESSFVICPRGLGPTSWRFYETMMAGRVPVVVSDRWLPAREIDWSSFSLRVPENRIDSIPRLCESNAGRAHEMGTRARNEWEKHCSLETAFGWVGRRLTEMHRSRQALGEKNLTLEFAREVRFGRATGQYLRWRAGHTLRQLGLR